MKCKHLPILVILILSVSLVCGCVGPSQGIYATSSSETPENFVNISEDRMHFFPHLEEAILNEGKSIITPVNEFYEVHGFLTLQDTNFVCYKNKYYEIRLYCAD